MLFQRLCVSVLLLALAPVARAVADDPKRPPPLPISAHNCYPENQTTNPRLVDALALGIDNIEIDLGWDDANRRLIVSHDAIPRPGVAYPELESTLVPALEAHWRTPRPDGAPTVLTIDWKTDHREAVQRFKMFLDAHPDWFTSAPKPTTDARAIGSETTVRRLTVCLSGSDQAKDIYDSLVPAGGVYRAFRDAVFGAGSGYRGDVAEYAPAPATPYHRFLAFHWSHVERGGPPRAGEWTTDESVRLAALVEHAHRQGFRLRLYTLNGHTGPVGGSYRFATDQDARIRWLAAARSGADWVASDEYAEIVRALQDTVGTGRAKP